MLSVSDAPLCEQVTGRRFRSFAIIDLEAACLPYLRQNKVGITELSIYGVAREEFEKERSGNEKIPKLPRVLHKLTLMINPRMWIDSVAERLTGLDNFMLEHESTFNENAATTLLSFLKHLQQPVCLVAHNGYEFDFPMVKSVLEKVQMAMPETVSCIDSLHAFPYIDKIKPISAKSVISVEGDISVSCELESVPEAEKNFDPRSKNETTPKRPTSSIACTAIKRKRNSNNTDNNDESSDDECQELKANAPKSKRSLDFGAPISTAPVDNRKENISYPLSTGKRWYPPKNKYKLAQIYERTFKQDPKQTHYAEADIMILTQLMLHYGNDFIDYAERKAVSFESIPAVGKKKF